MKKRLVLLLPLALALALAAPLAAAAASNSCCIEAFVKALEYGLKGLQAYLDFVLKAYKLTLDKLLH